MSKKKSNVEMVANSQTISEGEKPSNQGTPKTPNSTRERLEQEAFRGQRVDRETMKTWLQSDVKRCIILMQEFLVNGSVIESFVDVYFDKYNKMIDDLNKQNHD